MMGRACAAALVGIVMLAASGAPEAEAGSPGCAASPPAQPPETFIVDGRERRAITVAPADDQPRRPRRLIVAFHGRTNDNGQVRRYFGLERAAAEPAIWVYPAGLPDASGRFTWSDPGDRPGELRDLAFFDAIVERISAAYCVDQVFVVGHSLGATFANSVACARGGRVRGVASVAGGIATSGCTGDVAALLLHNPRDELVPLEDGELARDRLLDGASRPQPVIDRRVAGFACRQHGDGADPLLWCLHDRDRTRRGRFYPHQWPPGAAEAVMRFVETLDG